MQNAAGSPAAFLLKGWEESVRTRRPGIVGIIRFAIGRQYIRRQNRQSRIIPIEIIPIRCKLSHEWVGHLRLGLGCYAINLAVNLGYLAAELCMLVLDVGYRDRQ